MKFDEKLHKDMIYDLNFWCQIVKKILSEDNLGKKEMKKELKVVLWFMVKDLILILLLEI